MKKHSIVILAVIWMLVVVMGATYAVTLSLTGGFNASGNEPLIDGKLRVSDQEYDRIQRYSRLDEVREILKTEYYKELSDDELVLGAIRGMMAAPGDKYTFYYTPEEMMKTVQHTQGSYEGIGLVLAPDKDGYLIILRVFKDTPAYDAGIKPGDRIVKINGTEVSGNTYKDQDDAILLIKTATDPNIKLSLLRGEEVIEIPVQRTAVKMSRIDYHMMDGKIGYISISEFLGDDVVGFERALNELKSQGMKGLIVDVRSNPGGDLEHVCSIADYLLPKGLIVYTEDRAGRKNQFFSDENALNLPMAILTNAMSASASEILAGALQDYKLATVVGETTYGKGIVQTQIPFRSDSAGMQLTTARYFTPNGRSIHGVGIVPDVQVAMPKDVDATDASLNPDHDPQLMKAVEIVRKKIKK